ncbi:hypothetical protein M3Y99_01322600 [Aphelenchoides fujianensis]|nr:hypothetical protein M3Y99_01322600 [Aphelenchoides fujianensis]
MAEEKRQLEAQLSESFGTAANEKNQVAVMREQFDAQMQEAQLRFAALEAERNQERAAAEVAFADKDRELDRLRAELEKQEEKIHRYAKMFNAENPEVIAPAAAKTSKLMKDATSLTELYAAHFGLVVELETKSAQLKEAEKTLMAARKIFMDKASRMKQHEEHLTHFQRENDVLSAQLSELRKDREEIVSKATSFESELRFTKETLEVLQRECQTVTNNYNRLLLQVNTGSADPASNPEAFGSIQELQRQNLDLINKIQTMESEKEEAIRTSHNEQFEEMKRQLESTRHQLDAVEIRNNHLTASLGEAERQRDAFKKLHGELEKRMTEWLDPSRVLALRKDLEATLHRAEKAEEELRTMKEGFEQTQRHLESKVESREQIIQEHQATIASMRDALRGSKVAHQQALIVQTTLNRELTALRAENKTLEEKQRLLAQKNQQLVEKADGVLEEQKSSRAARMDVEKELADVKNALRLATIELNALKEQSVGRESLTTLVAELQSAVERKTLLLELANSRNSAAQQAEREQLESNVKQLEAEKKAVEDQLKLEVLKLQEECGRLRGEHQLSQKEIEPLKLENRDLVSQYESLSTAFVQCQKLLSDLQLQRVDEQMAMAEVEHLRKQVDEVMEMAEFWQTKYEQQLIGQATSKVDAEGGEGTIERCENPSHVALIQFVSECKRRLNESLSRNSTLLQQIGIHEVRLRQYAEDMRVAEELTSSQSERIAQLQVDGGELTKKFNELTVELEKSKGASLLQTEEINSLSLKLREFEEANQQLREDLQAESTQKNVLETRLETLENEFRSKIDQLTEFKIVAEEEKKTFDEDLTAAQQREADALEKLNELRAQLEGLQTETGELPAADVLQRTIANLRAERVQRELESTAQELQTRVQLLDEQKQQMGQVESLQSRVAQLEAETVELKKQSGGWEAEQKRLQDEIAAKQTEVEGLKEQADRLESALRSTTEDHNKSKEELGKVKNVAINYRNKFNKAQEELNTLKEQTVQKSYYPVDNHNWLLFARLLRPRELNQRAREVLKLSTDNQKLSQQVQTLEAEVNSLKSRIVDLEKENGEKQQELAAKVEELQAKTDELEAVKFRNQLLQGTHDKVKRQLQEKTAQLEALQAAGGDAATSAENPTA